MGLSRPDTQQCDQPHARKPSYQTQTAPSSRTMRKEVPELSMWRPLFSPSMPTKPILSSAHLCIPTAALSCTGLNKATDTFSKACGTSSCQTTTSSKCRNQTFALHPSGNTSVPRRIVLQRGGTATRGWGAGLIPPEVETGFIPSGYPFSVCVSYSDRFVPSVQSGNRFETTLRSPRTTASSRV